MSELKPLPCPFCGGAPRTVARPDNTDGTRSFYALACYCGGYSACAHQMGQVITRRPEGYQGDSLYSEDLW